MYVVEVYKNYLEFTCYIFTTGQKVIPNRPPGIYMQPDFNVYYKRGESVQLPCRADGVPRPT